MFIRSRRKIFEVTEDSFKSFGVKNSPATNAQRSKSPTRNEYSLANKGFVTRFQIAVVYLLRELEVLAMQQFLKTRFGTV